MDVSRETQDATTKPKCYDLTKIQVRLAVKCVCVELRGPVIASLSSAGPALKLFDLSRIRVPQI